MKNLKGLITLFALIISIGFVACSVENEKIIEPTASKYAYTYMKQIQDCKNFAEKLETPKTVRSLGIGVVCANADNTVIIHWVNGVLYRSVYNASNPNNPWETEVILDFHPDDCSVNHKSMIDKVVCSWTDKSGLEDIVFTVYRRSNGTYYTKGVGEYSGTATWDYAFDCPQK